MLNSYMYNLPDSGQAAVAFSDCVSNEKRTLNVAKLRVFQKVLCLSFRIEFQLNKSMTQNTLKKTESIVKHLRTILLSKTSFCSIKQLLAHLNKTFKNILILLLYTLPLLGSCQTHGKIFEDINVTCFERTVLLLICEMYKGRSRNAFLTKRRKFRAMSK